MQGIQNRFCPHQFPGLASGFNQPTLLCTLVGFFFLLFLVSSSVPCFWTADQVKMLGLCHTQSSRSTENVWFVVVPHTKSRMDSRTSTLQFTSPLSLLYTLFVGSKPKNDTERPRKSCVLTKDTAKKQPRKRGETQARRKPWPGRVTGRSVTTPPPPGCSAGRASSAPPCSARRGGGPPRRS